MFKNLTNRRLKHFVTLGLLWIVVLTGVPFQALHSIYKEHNIVDTLYHAQQKANVVDRAFRKIAPQAQADGATDAMMVYDTNSSSSVPKFREWNGTSWGSETSANSVTGDIRHMVVKYAPTRDEAIMVVGTNTGQIQAQVWNGSSWGSNTVLGTHLNSAGSGDIPSLYRAFDIEYEQSSGDAIVVYGDGTADPNYQVWNGTSWSGANNIDIATTGVTNWIELAANIGSGTDNLAFITIDANVDIYGMRWNGTAWDDMNSGGTEAVWDATGSIATKKSIDVAFERNSGDLLFVWGDGTATTHLNYRTYSGTTLSAATALANANQGGVAHWIKLAANPGSSSNEIMLGEIDAGADLNTFIWTGTAFNAVHAEHSAGTENVIDMNFDIVYETSGSNPDDAWLLWGNSTTISRRLWDGGTDAWQTATTSDDDTANIVLNAQPNSGAVFALAYDDDTATNDDIRELHLTGGSQTWSSTQSIWGGPVARRLGLFRMAAASQAYNSSTEAMMVYHAEDITAVPKYRRWTGASWGSQADTSTTNGEIRHMAVKFSPTRNEGIMVTLGSTGQLQAQVWNGSAWGSPSLLTTMNNANGSRDTQSLYRGFDIEYENTSGDAIVVYNDATADPNYRVWNGTSWSGETNIDIPTTGRPNWIELASSPVSSSDNLAMILVDANVDVYGMFWNGTAWDDMNSGGTEAVWDATGSLATKKTVDVAFERTSGDVLFIWGDATATTQSFYRTYSGTTLSAATALANANQGGVVHWARLATNPTASSNEIMYAELDAGADLNTYRWSGTAWSAVDAEHSATTEDIIDMNFDIVYETHASNANVAWLVWGDSATVSRKRWSGSAWVTATTSGDDTARVVLNAQPNSGAVFTAIYEDDTSATDDVDQINLTSGSSTWSTQGDIWTGPIRRNLGLFLVDVASERYVAASNPTFTQSAYRWYVDSDSENVTDPWGNPDLAESTTLSVMPASNAPPATNNELRLRVALTVGTSALNTSSSQFRLQYKAGTDGSCTTGSWTDVGAAGGGSIWRFASSTPTDGTDLTVLRLTPSDVLQEYVKSNPSQTNHNSATIGQDIEYDFHIEHNGAASATQYSFRVADSAGSALSSYTVCPTLTTQPETSSVMRHGNFFSEGTKRGFLWAN